MMNHFFCGVDHWSCVLFLLKQAQQIFSSHHISWHIGHDGVCLPAAPAAVPCPISPNILNVQHARSMAYRTILRSLQCYYALPQSRPAQISRQLWVQPLSHRHNSLADHAVVHRLTSSTDEKGRLFRNASTRRNHRPFVSEHWAHYILVWCCHLL